MDQQPAARDRSADALVAAAQALRPFLREAAPRIEAARALPDDVLAALHDGGMFRLLIPRELGGAEADLVTLAGVLQALAEGDASCAWCVGQAAGCAMSAAYLPADVARELFGRDERAVLAWGAGVNGEAVRDGDGWRVTGKWLFASGARHATLLGAQTTLAGCDGEVRTFLFPRAQTTLVDTWHVVGLRGTGSDGYAIRDLYIPDSHGFNRMLPAPHPGTLYRIPLVQVFPVAFGAVALGVARAVLDAFLALASDKTPRGSGRMRDSGAIQGLLGQWEARWRAARCYLLHSAAEIWADLEAGQTLSAAHSLTIRMASTHAIHESLALVDAAYHEAGASAIFDAAPFERRLRDMHAVAQQIQGRRSNFELAGRHLLGMTDTQLFF
ncbi:MAG: acyl-CoA dehydrogenase family protein [Rhodospirillales bacterium]|nr:acyl-CoA dehydrogenase family protein [Rhodospirillales bacterium]